MPKISELQIDSEITGDERIPVSNPSDNTNVAITTLQLNNYIANNIQQNTVISQTATQFSRTYTARGDIQRGKGVYLIRDNNNELRLSQLDGSRDVTINRESSDFEAHLVASRSFHIENNLMERNVYPASDVISFLDINTERGVRFTFEQQADGSYISNNSFPITIRPQVNSDTMITINSVSVNTSGFVTITYDSITNSRIWFRGIYNDSGVLIYSTGSDTNFFIGSNRTLQYGSFNVISDLNNQTGTKHLIFHWSTSDSSSTSVRYIADLVSSSGDNNWNVNSSRVDEDLFTNYNLLLSSQDTRFANMGTRALESFSLNSASIDSNNLNLTFSNLESNISSVFYQIKIDDNNYKRGELDLSTLSQSIELTDAEVTSIGDSLDIKFSSMDSFIFIDNLYLPVIQTEDSFTSYRQLVTNVIATNRNNFFINRLSSDRMLVMARINSTDKINYLETESDDSNNLQFTNSLEGRLSYTYTNAMYFGIYKFIDNEWLFEKDFYPTFNHINKNDNTNYITSCIGTSSTSSSNQRVFRVSPSFEDENEIIFCINHLSSLYLTSDVFNEVDYSTATAPSDLLNSTFYTLFLRYDKNENEIDYVLRDEPEAVYNYWELFQSAFDSNISIKILKTSNSQAILHYSNSTRTAQLYSYSQSDYNDNLISYNNISLEESSSIGSYSVDKSSKHVFFNNTLYFLTINENSNMNLSYIALENDLSDFLRAFNTSSSSFDGNAYAGTIFNLSSNSYNINPLEALVNSTRFSLFFFPTSSNANSLFYTSFPRYIVKGSIFSEATSSRVFTPIESNYNSSFSGAYYLNNIATHFSVSDSQLFYFVDIEPNITSGITTFLASSQNGIGISDNDYNDGETARVLFFRGSSLITLSGFNLNEGSIYYLQDNGDVSTNSLGRRLGTAISPTELLLD